MLNAQVLEPPIGWEKLPLIDLAEFLDGRRVPIKEQDREKMHGPYPYYGASGIIDYVNDYIFDEDVVLLAEDGANILNRATPIAFRVSGKCWVNNHAHVLRPRINADIEFLSQYLEAIRYDAYNTGSAQPKLNREVCELIPVLTPPLPEQRKIAEILRTWDAALEALTTLRTAKARLAQARLQSILNDDSWPEVALGDLGVISSAGVDKKVRPDEPSVRLLNFLDVLRRDFLYDHEFTQWVTASPRKLVNCGVQKGDVFFTPSSETRNDIAHSAVAMEDMPGVVYSYHVVRFRPSVDLDLNFRAFMFKSHHFLRQAYALAAGSGQRYVLSQDQFRQMTVKVPDVSTQKKIGAYFAASSRELTLLDAEIDALTRQKRGLMQKLLTGEWRVRPEASDDDHAEKEAYHAQ